MQCGVKLILFFCQTKRRSRRGCLHNTRIDRRWVWWQHVWCCVRWSCAILKQLSSQLKAQHSITPNASGFSPFFLFLVCFTSTVRVQLSQAICANRISATTYSHCSPAAETCMSYLVHKLHRSSDVSVHLLALDTFRLSCRRHILSTTSNDNVRRPFIQQLRISHGGLYGVMVVSVACPHPKRLN